MAVFAAVLSPAVYDTAPTPAAAHAANIDGQRPTVRPHETIGGGTTDERAHTTRQTAKHPVHSCRGTHTLWRLAVKNAAAPTTTAARSQAPGGGANLRRGILDLHKVQIKRRTQVSPLLRSPHKKNS